MDNTDHPRTRALPTPEEIRQACAEIRAEWSEDTEQVRRTIRNRCETMERPVVLHWPGNCSGVAE